MADEVTCNVETAVTIRADEHESVVLLELHVLCRIVVIQGLCCLYARNVVIAWRTDVDEGELLAGSQPRKNYVCVNLGCPIDLLREHYRVHDIVHIEEIVILADLRERVAGLKAARGASTDVITLK
jgi:hypothetical protein